MTSFANRIKKIEDTVTKSQLSEQYPLDLFESSVLTVIEGLDKLGHKVTKREARRLRTNAIKRLGWKIGHLTTQAKST